MPLIQRRWRKLAEADLRAVHGRRAAVEGLLQEAYGIGRAEAARQLDELLVGLAYWPSRAP